MLRRSALLLALPLALSACGEDAATQGAAPGQEGEPIAAISPQQGQAWTDMVAVTPELGYRMGNPEAPIKVVEFASLTCPHCAEFAAKAFEPLREKYVASGRVSLEMRNFVRDPLDLTGSLLTRCGSPESYFALTEQFFANQPAIFETSQAGASQAEAASQLPENQRYMALARAFGLVDFFAARGISTDQAATCLADGAKATALAEAAQAQGQEHNIQGTPSFLVNGENVNVSTWEELEPILQRMGAR